MRGKEKDMSNPLIPDTISGTLDWAVSHIATWDAAVTAGGLAGALGLVEADITALEAALTSADTGHTVAVAARDTSKAATLTQNSELEQLRDLLAITVSKIRAFAEAQADPNAAYAEAQIPPRANPTPAPAPTPPSEVSVSLNNDGDCVVAWKATRTNGDYWSVWRTIAGQASATLIGTTGSKSFVDEEVPQGSAWAIYSVYSHRGAVVSESSEPVQILFGTVAAA